MENNKNKKSVKFQGDMLNFCDFIQIFVFTTNHHLKLLGTGLSLVCCLVIWGSTGGFLLLRYFSGIVSHPGDLRVSQYVSVESSSLTHRRPYS